MSGRHSTIGRRELALGGVAWIATGCVTSIDYLAPDRIDPAPFSLSRGSRCRARAVGPTPEIAEGPFYLPRTPRTRYLGEPRGEGQRVVVTGRVLGSDCRPIEGAVLDFWQADERGVYDTNGHRFRGHQFTMRDGLYRLSTVRPGPESVIGIARTPHIHVKVQAPGSRLLTTQLYFAEETERNAADALFDRRTVMATDRSGRRPRARFDFILSDW